MTERRTVDEMGLIGRGPERTTVEVCPTCGRDARDPEHATSSHQNDATVEVEYVRADLHTGAVGRIAALERELGCAIDALEGKPWTGWSTDTARDTLQGGQR